MLSAAHLQKVGLLCWCVCGWVGGRRPSALSSIFPPPRLPRGTAERIPDGGLDRVTLALPQFLSKTPFLQPDMSPSLDTLGGTADLR